MRKSLAALAIVAAITALAGCSTATIDDARLQVIASTNVYGSIAAQIGGDRVAVTSLINSAGKDPHTYEATARDRLAVRKADLVIENGGGYDAFMAELIEGADALVLTAAPEDHSDHEDDHGHEDAEDHDDHAHDDHAHAHAHGDANEHVWFDLPVMTDLAQRIAAGLSELAPSGASDFSAAADELVAELSTLQSEVDALHQDHDGAKVFITEPLPGLLADAAGLVDVAPDGFASAVEEGSDVAPAILLEALGVVEAGEVRAVLTTQQTGGAETQRIIAAAEQQGIPVIEFSELLEPDQTYADWMRAAISRLQDGLHA